MSAIEQRARELLAAEIERDGFSHAAAWIRDPTKSKSLRHIEAEAIRAIIVALTPVKIDTGNLAGDPLYLALDALYDRGWTDLHQKRKFDPRGCNEWAAVLELVRSAITPPEGFVLVPVEPTQAMLDAMYGNTCRDDDSLKEMWAETLAARPEAP